MFSLLVIREGVLLIITVACKSAGTSGTRGAAFLARPRKWYCKIRILISLVNLLNLRNKSYLEPGGFRRVSGEASHSRQLKCWETRKRMNFSVTPRRPSPPLRMTGVIGARSVLNCRKNMTLKWKCHKGKYKFVNSYIFIFHSICPTIIWWWKSIARQISNNVLDGY